MPDPNPTTKSCQRTLNNGTTEIANYDIYENGAEYKFKVKKIQDKAQ